MPAKVVRNARIRLVSGGQVHRLGDPPDVVRLALQRETLLPAKHLDCLRLLAGESHQVRVAKFLKARLPRRTGSRGTSTIVFCPL